MTSPDGRLSVVTDDLSPRPAWDVDARGDAWLRGARCGPCHVVLFPARAVCHRCGAADLAAAPISPQGQLYSWSTVHVSGRRPAPYTLGYIDLHEGPRVLALIEGDTGSLRPGTAMRLVTGRADLTFGPADAEAR